MSPHKTNCSTHCTPNLQMAAKWACWGQFGRFLVLWTHLIKPDTMGMLWVKIGFEKGPFGDPKCVINGATQGGPEGCQMVAQPLIPKNWYSKIERKGARLGSPRPKKWIPHAFLHPMCCTQVFSQCSVVQSCVGWHQKRVGAEYTRRRSSMGYCKVVCPKCTHATHLANLDSMHASMLWVGGGAHGVGLEVGACGVVACGLGLGC